jgi:hypothetical protein
MSRRRPPLISPTLARAWAREISHDTTKNPLTLNRLKLFWRATTPTLISAELAAAMAPSERFPDGRVRLRVRIGPTFKDDTIRPGQRTWVVDFDPKTGIWDSPGVAPWSPGIAGLWNHIHRVRGSGDGRGNSPRFIEELVISLGFAVLKILARGGAVIVEDATPPTGLSE